MNQDNFEFYQKVNKPFQELWALNLETFNKMTKNTSWADTLSKPKDMQELIAAQMQLSVDASQTMLDYAKDSLEILERNSTEMTKEFSEQVNKQFKKEKKTTK